MSREVAPDGVFLFSKLPRRTGPALLISLFVLAYVLLPDYGIGWDEDGQREKGEIALDYVAGKWDLAHEPLQPDKPFDAFDQNFYNSIFPLTAVSVSKLVLPEYGVKTERKRMLVFHYLLLVVCFVGFWFFYKTLLLRFKDRGWAVLGLLLLILSPRVSFHSFFNVKDSVLQAAVTVATFTLFRLLQRPTLTRAALHGLACGLALAVRPTALIVVALSLFIVPLVWVFNKARRRVAGARLVGCLALFTMVAYGVMVMLWPFLWEGGPGRFLEAWRKFSSFPWSGELLLFNSWLPATDLPAYYLPGWIMVTTPLLIVAGAGAGAGLVLREAVSWCRSRTEPDVSVLGMDIIQLALPVGSVGAIIVLDSVVYDAWRHVYFIYPAIVYLATLGLHLTWTNLTARRYLRLRKVLSAVVFSTIVYLIGWCIAAHPHQYNYFNPLAGNKLERRYTMDYWGIGFQDALRRTIDQDTTGRKLRILVSNYSGRANNRMLPDRYRERIELVTTRATNVDYFISNFRFREHQELYRSGSWPYVNPVFDRSLPWHQGKVYEVYRPGPPPPGALE